MEERTHLSEAQLLAQARGTQRLSAEAAHHLERCPLCQRHLDWLLAGLEAVREDGLEETSGTGSLRPTPLSFLGAEPQPARHASREEAEELLSQWLLGEPLSNSDERRVHRWLDEREGQDLARNLGIELRMLGAALDTHRLSARGLVLPPEEELLETEGPAGSTPEIGVADRARVERAPLDATTVTGSPAAVERATPGPRTAAPGSSSSSAWSGDSHSTHRASGKGWRHAVRPLTRRPALSGALALTLALLLMLLLRIDRQPDLISPGGYASRSDGESAMALTLEGTLYEQGADGLWEMSETLRPQATATAEPVSCRPGMAVRLRVYGQGTGTLSLWQRGPDGEAKQLLQLPDVRMNATFEALRLSGEMHTEESLSSDWWKVPAQEGRWELIAVLSRETPPQLFQKRWLHRLLAAPSASQVFSQLHCSVKAR